MVSKRVPSLVPYVLKNHDGDVGAKNVVFRYRSIEGLLK